MIPVLRIQGREVTIFEAEEKLGGLTRYAIPNFKLPKKDLDREIVPIINMGVHVRYHRHCLFQQQRDLTFVIFLNI